LLLDLDLTFESSVVFTPFLELQVIAVKRDLRAKCSQALLTADYPTAEAAIYDSSLSKTLSKEHEGGRQTFDKVLRRLSNPLFFGMGAMYAVAPFIALMLAAHLRIYRASDAVWRLVLPTTNLICVTSMLVFLCFHLWVEGGR
jgi:hypothetical protein